MDSWAQDIVAVLRAIPANRDGLIIIFPTLFLLVIVAKKEFLPNKLAMCILGGSFLFSVATGLLARVVTVFKTENERGAATWRGRRALREAQSYYDQAKLFYEQGGGRLVQPKARFGLMEAGALDEYEQAEFRRARTAFERALRWFERIKEPQGRAKAGYGLGKVDIKLGRPKQARDHFERAENLSREAGDPGLRGASLFKLAQAQRRLHCTRWRA